MAAFTETHAQVKGLATLRAKATRTAAEDKELFLAELKLDLNTVDDTAFTPALARSAAARISAMERTYSSDDRGRAND